MPKKTSRKTSRSTPSTATAAQTGPTFSSRSRETAAPPDYSYVVNDLKRIGVLAGAFFLGMIVLYFVLPYILPLYAH